MPSLRTLPTDVRVFAKYHLKRRVYDHPEREADLGIVDLGFDLDAFVDAMRSLGDRYDVRTLAEVAYHKRSHPMVCATSKAAHARQTVVILGGVHGNEHAGILAVPEILRRIDEPAVRLVAVAPANPVGAAELSRYNADGFDINRDFMRFETPEGRAIRQVFEREQPDFVVSLHEGPQYGVFMFLNRFVQPTLAQHLATAVEAGGTQLAARDYFGRALRPPGIAPMTRPLRLLQTLWGMTLRMKSTGIWCDDRGIPEITLESSWRGTSREARVRPHVDLVCALVGELARAGDRP